MSAFENLARRAGFDAARIAGVPVIRLVALGAGQLNLVGIDDDHIVAHVHMRGERRLVLAAQAHGDDRSETAQNHAFGVDKDPVLFDIRRCCGKGFHV